MVMTRTSQGVPVVAEVMEDALISGESFGFNRDDRRMWVGEGPNDPERKTWSVDEFEVESAMQALVGLSYLWQALR